MRWIRSGGQPDEGSVTGMPTGFIDLDYKTSGFQPSDLILIAARPSMERQHFVLNIAEYMAFRNSKDDRDL